MPASGHDQDKDGVDDACDGVIGQTPAAVLADENIQPTPNAPDPDDNQQAQDSQPDVILNEILSPQTAPPPSPPYFTQVRSEAMGDGNSSDNRTNNRLNIDSLGYFSHMRGSLIAKLASADFNGAKPADVFGHKNNQHLLALALFSLTGLITGLKLLKRN